MSESLVYVHPSMRWYLRAITPRPMPVFDNDGLRSLAAFGDECARMHPTNAAIERENQLLREAIERAKERCTCAICAKDAA